MQKQDLEQFHAWFDGYVSTFYGDDEYINTNLKLKEEHSRLVCEQARYLADELKLSENQSLLAETIAIFHDVGRFEQFVKYKTYNDPRSINHNELAIEVLEKNKVLDVLDRRETEIVNTAIKLHNVKELPANLDDRISLQAKLIRDADKIDIYRVVIEDEEGFKLHGENFLREMEFPNEPHCTPEIVEAVMTQQRIDYSRLRTQNDFRLLQLSWVFDVNFVQTLKRIKDTGLLDRILAIMPQIPELAKTGKYVLDYVDRRISESK